jgi:hypothetical protein
MKVNRKIDELIRKLIFFYLGARELTIEMTEFMANKWYSELQIESPNKRFKMDPVVSK